MWAFSGLAHGVHALPLPSHYLGLPTPHVAKGDSRRRAQARGNSAPHMDRPAPSSIPACRSSRAGTLAGRDLTAWLGRQDSNSEMSWQNISLKRTTTFL